MAYSPLESAPILIANIGLGWKGLAMTNTLAYYEHSLITELKSFITFCPKSSSYNSYLLAHPFPSSDLAAKLISLRLATLAPTTELISFL